MFNAPGPSPPGGGVRGGSGFCSSAILELSAVGFQPSAPNDKPAAGKLVTGCVYRILCALGAESIVSRKRGRLSVGVNPIEARSRVRSHGLGTRLSLSDR